MFRVLQFGEGNFLRTFVDAYFDTLNGTYRCKSENAREIVFYKTGVTL